MVLLFFTCALHFIAHPMLMTAERELRCRLHLGRSVSFGVSSLNVNSTHKLGVLYLINCSHTVINN